MEKGTDSVKDEVLLVLNPAIDYFLNKVIVWCLAFLVLITSTADCLQEQVEK